MRFYPRFATHAVCVLGLLSGGLAAAEDAPSGEPLRPDPPIQAAAQTQETPTTASPEDKRVFGVLPNYRTAEDTGTYAPITAKQKMTIATKDTVDYPLFLLGAGLAGIAQLSNQHPAFGQGVAGFFHRDATAYADQASGNYMTEGILPVLFHEDPRYFRRTSARGGVWSRTYYAATRILVTKTDSGRTTFNYAEVVGNSISAALGNAYYPGETHLLDNVNRLGVALGTDAVSQILKEFWPDIKRKYFARHHKDADFLPASTTTERSGS
jgi:hypothetical protein